MSAGLLEFPEFARARERRERTVPTGMPSASAASSYERPVQMQARITSRWSSGRRSRSARSRPERARHPPAPVRRPLEGEPRECRTVPVQRPARVARAVHGNAVEPWQRAVAAEADLAPPPPRLEEDRRRQILCELPVTGAAHEEREHRLRVPAEQLADGRRSPSHPRDHSSASVRRSTHRRMSAATPEFRLCRARSFRAGPRHRPRGRGRA